MTTHEGRTLELEEIDERIHELVSVRPSPAPSGTSGTGSIADLEAPPAGLDYARVGDLVQLEHDDGRLEIVGEVVAVWNRGDAR